jgi:hypothetical protein
MRLINYKTTPKGQDSYPSQGHIRQKNADKNTTGKTKCTMVIYGIVLKSIESTKSVVLA